ncbi:MAG: DUF4363 family protein [Clostridia bacterium]|nr:DUF4363 family protein [Clostridia bacterium]
MKKFIVMIFIFIMLVGLCIWEQITVNKYLLDIKEQTLDIINISTDLKDINNIEIIQKVENLELSWKHHESILCLFSNHKDMRDLCIEIQKLRGNIEVNQHEDFTASLKVIYHLTEDYKLIMGTSFQNVF